MSRNPQHAQSAKGPAAGPVSELAECWQNFFERLNSEALARPAKDLERLCREWRQALGASWAHLWLLHQGGDESLGQWELASLDSDRPQMDVLPSALTVPSTTPSVLQYSYSLHQPILVENVQSWSGAIGGVTYHVAPAAGLTKAESTSLLCVPLAMPAIRRHGDVPTFAFPHPPSAVLCAHYVTRQVAPDMQWLLPLMATLSARFITESYEAARSHILERMTSISGDHLADSSAEPPEVARHSYLQAVIALIKEELFVKCVSIFYRNQTHDAVVCLASTGLHQRDAAPMTGRDVSRVAYRANEGATGRVFATGEPFFASIGSKSPGTEPKAWECPLDEAHADSAVVLYPILSTRRPTAVSQHPSVLGVIRCVGNLAVIGSHRQRNVDPTQLYILDFIARILAPVLETMAVIIDREKAISIVKHELFAPLRMIEDAVQGFTECIRKGKTPSDYIVPDLQFCVHTAANLVAQLDRSVAKVLNYSRAATHLEGDVVAPMKAMLSHYARQERQMEIRFQGIGEAIPKMFVDRTLVSRALYNLITNAVKYGEPGSTILVKGRREANGYYLDIVNKGRGITDEEASRVFEEGYRGSDARHKALGLGMGLTIARAIMEKHGGCLFLTQLSNPTIFSMFFPMELTTGPGSPKA